MSRLNKGYRHTKVNVTDSVNRDLDIQGTSWVGGPFLVDDVVYKSTDPSNTALVTWVDGADNKHIKVHMLEGLNFTTGIDIQRDGSNVLQNLSAVLVAYPTYTQAFDLYYFLKNNLTTWDVSYRQYKNEDVNWQWTGSAWIPANEDGAWDASNERDFIILTSLLGGYTNYQICICLNNGSSTTTDSSIASNYRDSHTSNQNRQMSISFNIHPTSTYQDMARRIIYAGGGAGDPPIAYYPWDNSWWYDITYPGTFQTIPYPTLFYRVTTWYSGMTNADLFFIEDNTVPHLTVYCKKSTDFTSTLFSCGVDYLDTSKTGLTLPYRSEAAFCGYCGTDADMNMLSFTWSDGDSRLRDTNNDMDVSTLLRGAVDGNMPVQTTKYITANLMRMASDQPPYGQWKTNCFRLYGDVNETLGSRIGSDSDYTFRHVYDRLLIPWDANLVP